MTRIRYWRVCFLIAAAGILAGGPMHPKGTMPEMLGNSTWVPAHSLMLAGFIALLIALILLRRETGLSEGMQKWSKLAVVATLLQAIEMALHDAATLDRTHLLLGQSTPILTTHLWLAVLIYPLFAIIMAGFILIAMRDRAVESKWIGWIGILGLIGHGISAPLVVAAGRAGASGLFALLTLFAIWMLLAALWPAPKHSI